MVCSLRKLETVTCENGMGEMTCSLRTYCSIWCRDSSLQTALFYIATNSSSIMFVHTINDYAITEVLMNTNWIFMCRGC